MIYIYIYIYIYKNIYMCIYIYSFAKRSIFDRCAKQKAKGILRKIDKPNLKIKIKLIVHNTT